jgi:hypothetical protein
MAGVGAIEETLLPAYLDEGSDLVRRAVWGSMLQLAGEAYVPNEKLALALLSAGKRTEADQICTRLHALKLEGELRPRRVSMEETVARAFFDARDFKTALPHLKVLAGLAPERADAHRRFAACQRELKDLEGCLRTLSELKDPEPLIEEATAQLPTAPTDERRKQLEALIRSAVARMIEPLAGKDEAARKTSLDALRRLGRKVLPALIAELEEGPKFPAAVLEAGQVVTGIPNDPAATNGYKSKAAAWRAWMGHK